MILIPTAEFPLPSSVGSSGSAAPTITCHQMLFEKRLLFVGTSTGSIVVMRRRVDSQGIEQIDSKPMILEGHTGLIRCLLLVRGEGLGQDNYLLFSGGADRTVRMWDPAAGRDGSKQCVQTLRGHGGTVTSIAYSDGVLVTSSTDNSIKVRGARPGRRHTRRVPGIDRPPSLSCSLALCSPHASPWSCC
jgi:WD40 repeat protein